MKKITFIAPYSAFIYIPRFIDYIVVSDLYLTDHLGGAELTTNALLEEIGNNDMNVRVACLYTHHLNINVIRSFRDRNWIFFNMTNFKIIDLIVENIDRYFCVEYDMKFCKYRSPFIHKMSEGSCECLKNVNEFIRFFAYAKKVFFMSEKQKNIYEENYRLNKISVLLTSVFSDNEIKLLKDLRKKIKFNRYCVIDHPNPLKGTKESKEYCVKAKIEFDIIKSNQRRDVFLNRLSDYYGLVYLPNDLDTSPRVVTEAKLMGLDLIINDNVGQRNEEWFKTDDLERIIEYIRTKRREFWEKIVYLN